MIGIDAAGIDRRIMLLSRCFNRDRNRGGLPNHGLGWEKSAVFEPLKRHIQ